jgi:4-hydroxy-tetrahydrodipicolinate synthase
MIRMIKAVRPNRPEFSFLTGWDAALMPLLLAGCDGGTNASSGVVPELTRKLYELTLARRLDDALPLQYDLVTLFDTMLYQAEFPDGFRAAVSLRGFQMGRGRQPLSEKQQADLSTLRNTLQCLLAAHGFSDQPVQGCSPVDVWSQGHVSAGNVQPDDVSKIVQSVVAELKGRGML